MVVVIQTIVGQPLHFYRFNIGQIIKNLDRIDFIPVIVWIQMQTNFNCKFTTVFSIFSTDDIDVVYANFIKVNSCVNSSNCRMALIFPTRRYIVIYECDSGFQKH